jgi:hypothetical protein
VWLHGSGNLRTLIRSAYFQGMLDALEHLDRVGKLHPYDEAAPERSSTADEGVPIDRKK